MNVESSKELGAEALRVEAAEWLMRCRTSDNWTSEDQQRLDVWLAESPAHLLAYWRLDAAWSRTGRLAALRERAGEDTNGMTFKKRWSSLFRMAALSLLAVIATVALFRYFDALPRQTYVTSIGGHETIRLTDGSQIELNTDTAVRVLDGSNQREIWLDKGEAYFQAKHDPSHPFKVITGDRTITDLGTKFSVRQQPTGISVTVFEGRVSVDDARKLNGARPISLDAGDTLMAASGKTTISKTQPEELVRKLEWRRGLLVFYRAPLAKAADELNRYNRDQIVIIGRNISEMSVTGTVSATDPDQFIRMARNLFGLQVERRNAEILISR